jgi:hypothetical protein
LDLSRRGQINDRFTKAIEQLGAVDQAGKNGLVYSLIGHRIGYSNSQEVSRCKHQRFL